MKEDNEREANIPESALISALEAMEERRQRKLNSSLKTIYTFFLIGAGVLSALMTYINATVISSKDFTIYKESQTEAISEAISKAILPIANSIGESNDQIATLSSEIVNLQLKFIELNGRISGNNFVTAEKFADEIQSLNSEIQSLRIRLMIAEHNKENIENLRQSINRLAQEISDIERRIDQLH